MARAGVAALLVAAVAVSCTKKFSRVLCSPSLAQNDGGAIEDEGLLPEPLRRLPERLLVGYPDWGYCGEAVHSAIANGVNVVAWSFGSLVVTEDGEPFVKISPDLQCVKEVADRYGRGVVHLLSFGGWNSPHPDPARTGSDYFAAWMTMISQHRRADGSELFDGVDWDLEGNDSEGAPSNTFSMETLSIVGEMSTRLKRHGFIVSLAPPESYLDARSPAHARFSRGLLFPDPDWEMEFKREMGESYVEPFFAYHGHNALAYLLAVYGSDTFDFISVQFYESFSHFGYDIQVAGVPETEAIIAASEAYFKGWHVDFASDPNPDVAKLGVVEVSIPPEKFVFGLIALKGDLDSNLPRTAPPFRKAFTLTPEGSVAEAFAILRQGGSEPRGAMYWCIRNEAGSSSPFYMSHGLAVALSDGGDLRRAASAAMR